MSPDSAIYLGTARSLAGGKGLTVPFGDEIYTPLVQFPPLYPMLLALPAVFGADPVAAAVPLQVLLFIGNVTLIFIAVRLASGKDTWAAFAAALIATFSPATLLIHQMAWSEGFFILLELLALLLVSNYLETGRRRFLMLGALAAGLGAATRFAGLAFISALVLGVLILQDQPLRLNTSRRLVDALIAGMIAALPLSLWFFLRIKDGGEATTRQFAFHPPGIDHFRSAVDTISGWMLVPNNAPILLKAFLILLVTAACTVLIFRYVKSPGFAIHNHPILGLTALSTAAYGSFILISLTFMDANIPLDARILARAAVNLLILILGLLGREVKTDRTRWIANLVLVFVMVVMIWKDLQWSRDLYYSGGGYNSPMLRSQELIDQIKALPEDSLLYSNSPEALYFQTGRSSLRLPKKIDLMSQKSNANLTDEMTQLNQKLQASHGYIVYYTWVHGKTILSQEDLSHYLPVNVLIKTNMGLIFAVQKTGE